MTEHLTRHSAEHDEDLTARDDDPRDLRDEGDVRDEGNLRDQGTAEVPGQDRAEYGETGTGEEADHTLSTADLASASAGQQEEDTARTDAAPAGSGGDVETPTLIDEEKVTGFRDRWQNVQTGFVDDPKQAVQQADELVAAVISALATTFAEHKSELEAQWQQGEPATEELRIALRRYRAFFDQLLPH